MTRSPRPELLGLLQTARESPGDLAPRLVVADWLEEHGDESDRARAEFIRLQHRPDDPSDARRYNRMNELHRKHYDEWVGAVRKLCKWGPSLEGGFLNANLSGATLVGKKMDAVKDSEAWAWVSRLHVSVTEENAAAVAASPLLGHAGALTVDGKPEALLHVFASPRLRSVRQLYLRHTRLSDEGVRHLAASEHLGNVVELNLGDNRFTDDGMRALAKARSLRGVRTLTLDKVRFASVKIGAPGVAALFASGTFPDLTALDLSNNHLDNDAAEAIAEGRLGEQLESLRLHQCRCISAASARRACRRWPGRRGCGGCRR
jgi:uncharacterized protein (TIGR02996 family)